MENGYVLSNAVDGANQSFKCTSKTKMKEMVMD